MKRIMYAAFILIVICTGLTAAADLGTEPGRVVEDLSTAYANVYPGIA